MESRVDFLIAEYPAYIKLKGGGDSFSTSSIWRSEASMVLSVCSIRLSNVMVGLRWKVFVVLEEEEEEECFVSRRSIL